MNESIPVTAESPLPDAPCPTCGRNINGTAGVQNTAFPPRAGDLALCLNCGELLEFGDDMSLAIIDPETLRVVEAQDPEVAEQARALQQKFRDHKGERFVVHPKKDDENVTQTRPI